MNQLLLFLFYSMILYFSSCNSNNASIPPDDSDMNLQATAMELSKTLKIGFNIGNTFEAIHKTHDGKLLGGEITWGNPTPNADLFRGIKAAGFNFVRMPVSYLHQFADSSGFEIKKEWPTRSLKP